MEKIEIAFNEQKELFEQMLKLYQKYCFINIQNDSDNKIYSRTLEKIKKNDLEIINAIILLYGELMCSKNKGLEQLREKINQNYLIFFSIFEKHTSILKKNENSQYFFLNN